MPDTLATTVSHSLDIKHSRFIAHAAPIPHVAAALEFLQQVAVVDATHNCPIATATTTVPATTASPPAPPAARSWRRSMARASTG